MTEKDIQYRLTADPLNMERGFKSAEASAAAFERELARLEAQQKRVDDAMDLVGKGVLAGGAAIAVGLGLAAKAAIEWESAWADVLKVVDGTPEEIAALEAEIRGLTQTLPQTHEEIAAVAAAAGQLGVKRQDIAEFTKIMVAMGVSTDLSSDQAATALARMMNIMQTAPDDVGRLGSAVVALGNSFAATESEIVDMALRTAGAGHTIGLTEANVLGFSAALSNVGIEAEAGGTAVSTAFVKIESAVREGGEQLDKFAAVAGMSSDEFTRAYEQDAARAIASFILGLGRMNEAGGDVFGTLADLEMGEIRLRDAMLRLAGAGDLITQALDIANAEWDANTALLAEAERRYETTEAKLQIARNSLNDLAIDIGQTFLPMIGGAADAVRALGEFFGDLPGPLQAALAILAALTAALLLAGGTALIAVPRIAAYREAIDILANSTGRLAAITVGASTALGRVGTFLAGPWGIAIGLAVTAITAFGIAQGQADSKADDLSRTLDEQTGAVTEATRAWVAHELEQRGVLAIAQEYGLSLSDLVDAILGEGDAMDQVTEAMSGHTDEGGKVLGKYLEISGAIQDTQTALEEARRGFERTDEAVHGTGDAIDRLDPATRELAEGLDLTADEAKGLTDQLDALDDALKAVLDQIFGLSNAQDDLADAVDTLTEGIQRQREANEDGAGAFDGNSKAARENRDALQEVLEAQAALVLETIEQTGSTEEAHAAMDAFKTMMAHLADQLGIDITQVEGYNEAVDGIERQIDIQFETNAKDAADDTQTLLDKLANIPRQIITNIIQYVSEQSAGGGGKGHAFGGWVDGPPGVDNVPSFLTAGEFVVNRAAAQENAAVLEAINAGARMPIFGSSSMGFGGGPSTVHNEWNIYPATQQFGPAELQLVMAQHEAKERVGRPR